MKDFAGFIHKHYYSNPFPLLFIMLVLPYFTLKAQTSAGKKKARMDFDFRINTYYDDNILKYSDKYIDRFLNNEDTGRFHIKTYDDIILSPEIELAFTSQFFRKLNTTLNAGYKNTSYVVNSNKSRNYFYCGLKQNLTKKASIKLAYNYTPYFYIRHFRDDDRVALVGYTPESFQPFSFSKDNYSAEIQNTFRKSTRVRLIFDFSKYYYNNHFTEYDCNNNALGINLRQALNKNLRLEAGYTYTSSKAKGFDQPGETRQISNDSDGSYVEDEFVFRVLWALPDIKKHKHSLDIKSEFGRRYFTSDKSITLDPLHAGRVDTNFLLNGTYTVEISKVFGLSVFYSWYSRKAASVAEENSQYISDEKDYGQNQVGLALTYNIKL